MNDKDRFINNIEEDQKENGFRKWLAYLKFWVKYEDELDDEDIQDLRDSIEYNYDKEENTPRY